MDSHKSLAPCLGVSGSDDYRPRCGRQSEYGSNYCGQHIAARIRQLEDALKEACDSLKRLQEEYDPTDTEDGIVDIERLRCRPRP